MPIMDGVTACMHIQAQLGAAAPPVVALTAACSEEEKQRCLAAGMAAHLSKPVCASQMGMLHEVVLAARRKRQLLQRKSANDVAPQRTASCSPPHASSARDFPRPPLAPPDS
jgi:CheY-like chemotaxis protein